MAPYRRYTDADRHAARAMAATCTATDAARLLDIPYSTLITWARRQGWSWYIPHNSRSRHHPASLKTEAHSLALAGHTRTEVAAKLDLPFSTVSAWARNGDWSWPTAQRPRRHQPPARQNRNCDTCPDRPQCSQHHCLCEQPIMIDNHPDSATLSFEEAYPYG